MTTLGEFADSHLDGDRHYLTAYNAETWKGGFDLPFLRTACVNHDMKWPFPDLAYADMFDIINRFNTDDTSDLVGVYDPLVGRDTCNPFDDSAEAVTAFEEGDWESLLLHNLADIQRTHEIALLAGEYVAQSVFGMKNLTPPERQVLALYSYVSWGAEEPITCMTRHLFARVDCLAREGYMFDGQIQRKH